MLFRVRVSVLNQSLQSANRLRELDNSNNNNLSYSHATFASDRENFLKFSPIGKMGIPGWGTRDSNP